MTDLAASRVANPRAARTARPRQRMQGDARRQQFIDIALHLFATRGFRGTTTKAIAEAAGVSEAMLFRHFPTKHDLYEAIVRHQAVEDDYEQTVASLRERMEAGDDEGLVLELSRKIVESYERDRDFQRVMLLARLEGEDLAAVSHEMLGAPVFTLLLDYVVKRQRAGAFRRGDPALQVLALVSLPLYFSIVTSLLGIEIGVGKDKATAAAFAELILGGLRRVPGTARGANPIARELPSRKPTVRRRNRRHS